MRRRDFVAMLAGAAAARPLAARAQQPAKFFRIGFLTGTPLPRNADRREKFREALREHGYVEDRNIAIEWRSSEGNPGRRPALAADLARLKVDVIVAVGRGDIRAARKATATIPIVMVASGDPVASGLVASLARPGGNITGLATFRPELGAKRLEILKETVPRASRVAVFLTGRGYTGNGKSASSGRIHFQKELDLRARAMGVTLQYLGIQSPTDIETAFRAAVRGRADAVLFRLAGPIVIPRMPRIAEVAAESRLPVIYERAAMVEAGGFMSYGVDRPDLYRRAASYVDKILKGAKPADLPVQEPTRFELAVNLKTAKALGIAIPPSILLRADTVIE